VSTAASNSSEAQPGRRPRAVSTYPGKACSDGPENCT
jgi:hypothetical protein